MSRDTPPTRQAVYRIIAEAGDPISIDRICSVTGLHANTVRPHLDVLLAAGAIAREQGPREGRGRPPWRYRAIEAPQDRERRTLADALLAQLELGGTPELVGAAGRRWAQQLDHPIGPADSADGAVEQVADALQGLGFEVSVTPARDRLDLLQCPYADLVAEQPVICDIHAALVRQLLDSSGQPVELERFDVFPRPGVCTAHLRRGDQQPVRTITMRSPE